MTKKPKAAPEAPPAAQPGTTITGCHIEVHSAANEYTRDAIVALASAAQANAMAIEAAAKALAGNSQINGIRIG